MLPLCCVPVIFAIRLFRAFNGDITLSLSQKFEKLDPIKATHTPKNSKKCGNKSLF